MVKKINLLLFLFFLIILQACTTNKEVVNISVKDMPEQIEIGAFDDAGIKFVIEYTDGSVEEEEVTESIIPEEYRHYLYKEGEHSFSFLYKGIEVNFKFTMYNVKYQVSFENAVGEIIKTIDVIKGERVEFPTPDEMEVPGYRFLNTYDHNGTNINKNTVIKGNYIKVWTVTFYDGFNNLISTQIVDENSDAIAPSEESVKIEGYKFVSWDKSFTNITCDLNIYGIYEQIKVDCNHDYYDVVTNPTCKNEGYTTHICSICNSSYVDTYTSIIDHIEGEFVTIKESTCTEYGLKQTKCTVCNEVLSTETIDLINHEYVDNKCTMCGKSKPMTTITPYVENGMTYVNIGRYPQTVVDDNNLISILDTISTTNLLGYIQYDGEEYKKIISNPFASDYTFINGNIIKGNVTYYFKVEPIKWRVLYQENNEYTLLCEMLLDNINYYHTDYKYRKINGKTIYNNNYKYSNVRAWLNGYDGTTYDVEDYTNIGFYDVAFTEEEKIYINKTLVDNSLSSTGYKSNPYVCEDTNDYLYLLSYKDVINSTYGFDSSNGQSTLRQAIVSDYARAKYCHMDSLGSCYLKGYWWLRSPYYFNSNYVRFVDYYGYVFDSDYYIVDSESVAVRPAMKIILK